ncbi:DegT/DnrJ/EryC1/StrS family aminotransferase [Nitrospirillum iridis]|uniref:dTDP-4-amino-4,6-dideoxygalactose transaminase n=1 Tax=Nitrospirillum iridis TaxID=765888 RepID=A0A7X0EHB0_9PROT|nr:DegT/DnrJ/EryC1/StrS family aminotransferase [Nitrospirillum iridis]MBB6254444.1 dTDP-4-amino-4,6-dideoxygalactose transaminase [Nitrospirillum iridis]
MRVPLNDLQRACHRDGDAIAAAMARVVARGRVLFGPETAAFEAAFAAYCGTSHCLGVGNGTDALELALRALGVGPGDEVVTVANGGFYATTAILAVGARPRFADIDPGTLTLSPVALAGALTPRTRAIIVTHLYGRLADMDGVLDAAGTIPVIEDCAQAHGAQRRGRRAGAFGAIGCFSFYPTKNLGALGDAGAVVTSDAALADRLGALRQYGWGDKYVVARAGGRNSRMDEIQAAVLTLRLPALDDANARRRAIIARYHAAVPAPVPDWASPVGLDDVAHLAVVRSPDRARLAAALARAGVDTAIHYPVPDHHQPALRPLLAGPVSLPVTEQATAQILTLPCFPEMTEDEVVHVAAALADVWVHPA